MGSKFSSSPARRPPGIIYGYARVSTTQQSAQPQIDALTTAGVKPENLVVEQVSGLSAPRPGLDGLLTQITAGDELIVWKLDRLGRSLPDLIRIITLLGERGAQFSSLSDTCLDTTTAQGRGLFAIMSSLTDFQRDLVTERTQAGLEAARKAGKKGGRPTVVSPEQEQEILACIEQGDTQAAAARKTSLHPRTVSRLLRKHPEIRADNQLDSAAG